MSDHIDRDGFRANVGIVLMQEGGCVFLGQRVGGKGWQFPQGGVHLGETLEQAMLRELGEEIGLGPADVEVLGVTTDWLRYRLPARVVRRDQSPVCIGQKQRWFLLRMLGDITRIRFDLGDKQEFDDIRWIDYWEPAEQVVAFKRNVYRRALEELRQPYTQALDQIPKSP